MNSHLNMCVEHSLILHSYGRFNLQMLPLLKAISSFISSHILCSNIITPFFCQFLNIFHSCTCYSLHSCSWFKKPTNLKKRVLVMFNFWSTASCKTVTNDYNFMFILFWYVLIFIICIHFLVTHRNACQYLTSSLCYGSS